MDFAIMLLVTCNHLTCGPLTLFLMVVGQLGLARRSWQSITLGGDCGVCTPSGGCVRTGSECTGMTIHRSITPRHRGVAAVGWSTGRGGLPAGGPRPGPRHHLRHAGGGVQAGDGVAAAGAAWGVGGARMQPRLASCVSRLGFQAHKGPDAGCPLPRSRCLFMLR